MLADNDCVPHTCFVHYIGEALYGVSSNTPEIYEWRVEESSETEVLNICAFYAQNIAVEFP